MVASWLIASVLLAQGAAQPKPPAELLALMAKARLDAAAVSWCRGSFRPGRSNAYAVAVMSGPRGGSYFVIDNDANIAELGAFTGTSDLSCYAPGEARKLNDSIRKSDTISGRIAPIFSTTVVCGFVDDTSAVCWQYSPAARAFIKIGEWHT